MFIYSLLFYCLLPILLLRLIWRGFKAPQYWHRWSERFGFFKLDPRFESPDKKIVWLHAVSVGEVLASNELVKQLLVQYPNVIIVLTTMTPTGSVQVNRLFGDAVFHVYVPYDMPDAVLRFLNKIKPDVFLIMETEIWPNIITQCDKKNIPVALINGRLSEKSLSRYQKLPNFSSTIFNKINTLCVQSEGDKKRFSQLKSNDTSNILVTGNIKSDINIDCSMRSNAAKYKQAIDPSAIRPTLIAASTHQGEEEIILEAYKLLKPKQPSLLLILVPRHPERFGSVAELCKQEKLTVSRKSINEPVTSRTDILLADTMGELFMLYGVCDVAIMGGTFVEHGGHNPLEPAAWGLPIIGGQSDYNFSLISEELMRAGVLTKVNGAQDLADNLEALLVSAEVRQEKRSAAIMYIEKNRGALSRLVGILDSIIEPK